ncbi:MAG: putative toxin-antitoxin system toxin component, PIN family [Clostridiales Family XIII bacterium]|jgi:putative PIN family toxin of toxin-antitoxin system|nr:putative toxin-antitoxin system toxin component, PIN family [Clostridiales Family XIII bacterium]
MKVLLDTNVLFSAVLSADSTPMRAFCKAVTPPNRLFICEQTIEELKRTFQAKFPQRLPQLHRFIDNSLILANIVPIPPKPVEDEALIRDESDRPIFRAAASALVDVFVTGDKDFLESGILNPKIMTPTAFIHFIFQEIT